MNENKEEMLNKMSVHIADELKEVEQCKDKKEMIEKANVLFNLHKIILNYDELEPVLTKFFEEKKKKYKECKVDISIYKEEEGYEI